MVIDIHAHCFPDNIALKAVPLLAKEAGVEAYSDGTVSSLKVSMNQANIDISVLQPVATKPDQTESINRWSIGINCRSIGIQNKRIISFGTIHPDYGGWKEQIHLLEASGIKGIKMHPDYQKFFVDEKRLFPIYEEIFSSKLILLLHTGIDIGLPKPCHCTPSRLAKVLDAFPEALIIAAHMGGYKCWDEVNNILTGRDLFFDTSYSFDALGAKAMKDLIRNHGVDKILFGSDSPWNKQNDAVLQITSLDISDEEKDKILYGNSKRLLGI
ncbi:MAG: amidohydrolase family protein [Clostridiales bacterium]|nr:amidohydrolase family protein [Clostridiales bacterium]